MRTVALLIGLVTFVLSGCSKDPVGSQVNPNANSNPPVIETETQDTNSESETPVSEDPIADPVTYQLPLRTIGPIFPTEAEKKFTQNVIEGNR